MTNTAGIPRNLVILGIILPLAAMVGFFLATPTEFTSLAVIGLVIVCLLIPVALRWHHPLLIASWFAGINVFFLPGQPRLWMLLAVTSLGISILNRLLDKERRFLYAPGVTWSLVIFAVIVLLTAYKTGGLGARSLGSGVYGGKKYGEILIAIIGFFALTGQRIAPERAPLLMGFFLCSSITLALTNLIYLGGPAFFWLYWIFPSEYAVSQAVADFSVSGGSVYRMGGMGFACLGPYLFLLARYGARGVIDISKPWRLLVCLALVGISLVSGFRSIFLLMGLTFAILFWLEGLHRTKLLPVVAILGILGLIALIPISDKLPLSVQRSLSFLPFLEVSAVAKQDAMSSTQWRLEMWHLLLPDLPKYLLLGKGYAIDPTAMYLATQSVLRGLTPDIDLVVLVGDYHSGPLSIFVGFGLIGTIAFILFLTLSLNVLRANRRFGDPRLRTINTFLFGYFIAKIIFFVVIFGAINSDLFQFVGLVGLSICFNGGVRKSPEETSGVQAHKE